MTTFDFSLARNKHLIWKIKLRGFLEGRESLTVEQALSHEDCDLGQWLYNDGMNKYGAVPEMQVLEKEHIKLHAMVKMIVEAKHAGDTLAARAGLDHIDVMSDQVVALLTAVEYKVTAG